MLQQFRRMFATMANDVVRLEPPPSLKLATLEEIRGVLPFSYEMSSYRRRGWSMSVLFKPEPEFQPSMSAVHTSPRLPSDSYLEIVYPFSSSPVLRDQYRRFQTDKIRLGMILEDLDTLSGDIAGRHAGLRDKIVLTAFVDKISWLSNAITGEVTLDSDLKLAGQVTWVGRSSMEILVELSSRDPRQQDWRFVGFARFVMVARNKSMTAATPVCPLQLESEADKALHALGEQHMQRRQQRRDDHWQRKPPTEEEVQLIHQVAVRSQALQGASSSGGSGGSGPDTGSTGVGGHSAVREAVTMKRTELHSSMLMHAQDRNNYNRIFGGHLLRLATEHAFATAAIHAGEYCDPVSMEDVAFMMPVPIGCVLRLRAKVVYTEGPLLRVHVEASKVEPGSPEEPVVTNVFSFSFLCRSGPVRKVVPETVVEALQYVQGYRQHKEDTMMMEQGGGSSSPIANNSATAFHVRSRL